MPDHRFEMQAKLARLRVASGGAMDLLIYDPGGLADLDELAASGDQPAVRVRAAVQEALDAVAAARWADPCLCSACRRPLGRAYSIVIAYADLAEPGDLLALVVCRRCGTTEADVLRQVQHALRRVWPKALVKAMPGA